MRSIHISTSFAGHSSVMMPLAKRNATSETQLEKMVERKYKPLASKIERVLRTAAERVAAKVAGRFGKMTKSVEDDIKRILAELALKDVSVQVVDEVTPAMVDAFKKAGITGLARLGFGTEDITNHVDKRAIEYAKERAAELVTKITETSREAIRDEVERGVRDGLSSQELASNIRESRAFSRERSIMIARTELAFSHVAGNIEGWKASGQVEQKQWQSSINCCPICDLMDGVIVELDDKFDFDGEQVDGPPGHPNCRCDVLPVLTTKGEKQ